MLRESHQVSLTKLDSTREDFITMEVNHWLIHYAKERANGGPDRSGQVVVISERDGKPEYLYFSDETSAIEYVAKHHLEGQVPISRVP